MGRTGIVVTGLVALALIIGGVIVLKGNEAEVRNQTSQTTTKTQAPQPANLITYSDSGFSPSTLGVKSGDSLTIKNSSSSSVQIQSNPHPIHTDNEELNVGEIAPGQSKSFTPSKVGSWGYHNHLDPTQTGTIVVR